MVAQKKNQIDIPVPDFLKAEKELTPTQRNRPKDKHAEAYEAFCKWAALPKEKRKPTTQKDFEKVWKLPIGYASKWKDREDFQAERLRHYWNWVFDLMPEVVYSIYKRATASHRSSSSDAKVFVDLVGKKLETDRPPTRMTPFIMVGVPQDRIENLFVPKSHKEVIEQTVKLHSKDKVEDAEVLDTESA